jgi:hypothetical protein
MRTVFPAPLVVGDHALGVPKLSTVRNWTWVSPSAVIVALPVWPAGFATVEDQVTPPSVEVRYS